jgi:uncharacterized protein
MGVEVRPLSVLCNIQCLYCYQHPQRDSDHVEREYDLDKIKDAIVAEGSSFTLFGGEPLLVPIADLEDLWEWGFTRFGHNTVQTNGTLITDEHIALFKKYRVHVGISLDGPAELNDVRWHGTLEATRTSTMKAQKAIERLCMEGLHPALIITLHKGNASVERLPLLLSWVESLGQMGMKSFRLHVLESESDDLRSALGLSTEENINALLSFLDLGKSQPQLVFDLFKDMTNLLLGKDTTTSCVWGACDPYTTAAVRGIEGHGQRSNCGRTNKDGIDFGKGSIPGFERYIALAQTSQEDNGCQGCRFLSMCKGQCPGTAADGDWRNRSEHCDIWKAIFTRLEGDLRSAGYVPLSLSHLRPEIETRMLAHWGNGRNYSISKILGQMSSPPEQQPVFRIL